MIDSIILALPNISNASGVIGNATGAVIEPIKQFAGNWALLVGAAVLIVAAFVIFTLFKQVIANAILGIIALLVLVFVFGVPIPLSPLVILVSVLGGLGGVGAVLIATFFGWL
jgi:uncharacterized membrane protein